MMVIMVMRLIRLKMDNSELWSDIGQSYIIRLKMDDSKLWSDIGQSHIIRLKMDNTELWSDIGHSYLIICQAIFVALNVLGLLCHRRFQGGAVHYPPPFE